VSNLATSRFERAKGWLQVHTFKHIFGGGDLLTIPLSIKIRTPLTSDAVTDGNTVC
jgi:hypothetical protein